MRGREREEREIQLLIIVLICCRIPKESGDKGKNLLVSHRHRRETELCGEVLGTHHRVGMNRNHQILLPLKNNTQEWNIAFKSKAMFPSFSWIRSSRWTQRNKFFKISDVWILHKMHSHETPGFWDTRVITQENKLVQVILILTGQLILILS